MSLPRETFRSAAELAELDALVPIVDKLLGYPRPGWTIDGKRLSDGVGTTKHYALPQPNHDRSAFALFLPDLDPDNLPDEAGTKLDPAEQAALVTALRARVPRPADWAGNLAAEVLPDAKEPIP